jgi:hypothetical protein
MSCHPEIANGLILGLQNGLTLGLQNGLSLSEARFSGVEGFAVCLA